MIALLWISALAVGGYAAQKWLDDRDARREGVWTQTAEGGEALVLRADRFGQYALKGTINGKEVQFLVDTGASGISIPDTVARQLGLQRGRGFQVSTANGVATVYQTRLDSIGAGPLVRRDMAANINPHMGGATALLGMSFLRHYELVHRDGELSIRLP